MPDPTKHDPDTQPSNPPSDPYRKSPTKPVGRDSDASPGQGNQPPRTPNRVDPLDSPERSGTPSGGEVDDADDVGRGSEGDV
jgi:hypothetical protein